MYLRQKKLILKGGVVYIESLKIPPAPKLIKEWTIRRITSLTTKVKRIPYEQRDSQGELVEPPPAQVKFVIPPYVIIRGTSPQVAWWDKVF